MPESEVRQAISRARAAAQEFVESTPSLRVEGVERLHDGSWKITLSWLELDEARQLEEAADPLRALGLRRRNPLERVYRFFIVDRHGASVKMQPAPTP